MSEPRPAAMHTANETLTANHLNQASNRLDRLVSGIMIIATNRATAQRLGKDFQTPGRVKKEYVARVFGKFPHGPSNGSDEQDSGEQAGEGDDTGPGEEVVCEAPILCIDKQIGVNVVHPTGRVRAHI